MKKKKKAGKKDKPDSKKKNTSKEVQIKRIELSPKEFRVNLEQLQEDVSKAYESMKKMVPHAMKNVKVKKFGNASHIILPKEFAGKKAVVFVKKD